MRVKALVVAILAFGTFFFVDARLHIFFFKGNAESASSVFCPVVRDLENLELALKSGESEIIKHGIDRLNLKVRVAFAIETRFSTLGREIEPNLVPDPSLRLNSIRLQFEEFSRDHDNYLRSDLAKIEEVRKESLKALTEFC